MTMPDRLLFTLAGFLGALGVILLAIAAHGTDINNATLATAAQIMLFHAPALVGMAILAHLGIAHPLAIRLSAWMLVAGITLFSGDLCMRVFLYERLFPNAAPTGGFLMIGAWLLFTLALLFTAKNRKTGI